MINREEAKQKALTTVERTYSVQLETITNQIDEAAQQGKFETEFSGTFEDEVQSYLVNQLNFSLSAKYVDVRKEDSTELLKQPVTVVSWQDSYLGNEYISCKSL